MTRARRICPAGFFFHVLNRANSRNRIFNSNFDYADFLDIIREAMGVYPTKVMAYCLMPNHWHFLLQPSADNELSSFMGWISTTHTRKYRRSNHSTGEGPLYQGRFKSFPIKCDDHFFIVRRYIERNPIRASLVTKAQDWAWSSIGQDYFDIPKLKLSDDIMRPQENWLAIVNSPQTEAESKQVQTSIIKGKPFGDVHWCKETAAKLHLELTLRDAGRPPKTTSKN